MWYACVEPILWCTKKTVPQKGCHFKINIKSTKEAKGMLCCTTKNRMPTFIILNFHGLTFVIWAAICLTSEIWPFVGSFFATLSLLPAALPILTDWDWESMCWESGCLLLHKDVEIGLHAFCFAGCARLVGTDSTLYCGIRLRAIRSKVRSRVQSMVLRLAQDATGIGFSCKGGMRAMYGLGMCQSYSIPTVSPACSICLSRQMCALTRYSTQPPTGHLVLHCAPATQIGL